MLFTADQLVAHLVGDYVFQSDWQANVKRANWRIAALHAVAYGLPFLVLTRSPAAIAVIVITHAVIDRYGLARYVVWAKNQLAPAAWRKPWRECAATGYPSDRPAWLTTWLTIIVDNLMHIAINAIAIGYL